MTERGVWITGLAAFALLAVLCIRHHLPTPAAAAAPAVAAEVAPAPTPVEPRLAARWDGRTAVIEGTVPDAAARDAVLARARAVYGTAAVQDRLQVAGAPAPAWWVPALAAAFPPDLRALSPDADPPSAALADGALVLTGRVPDEPARQALVAAAAQALPAVRIDDRLTVARALATAASLADVLRGRTVEFDSGSATLTPRGRATLEALLPALRADTVSRLEIGGHTDGQGDPADNLRLSEDRARTVRGWLELQGVAGDRLTTRGYGATVPVADDATAEGRQRNRRIEFRAL